MRTRRRKLHRGRKLVQERPACLERGLVEARSEALIDLGLDKHRRVLVSWNLILLEDCPVVLVTILAALKEQADEGLDLAQSVAGPVGMARRLNMASQ